VKVRGAAYKGSRRALGWFAELVRKVLERDRARWFAEASVKVRGGQCHGSRKRLRRFADVTAKVRGVDSEGSQR